MLPSLSSPSSSFPLPHEIYLINLASTLDRILLAYGLPRDSLGLGAFRSSLNLDLRRSGLGLSDTDRAREQKLRHLFEFLGVDMRDGFRDGLGFNDGLRRLGGPRLGGFGLGSLGLGGLSDRLSDRNVLEERLRRRGLD